MSDPLGDGGASGSSEAEARAKAELALRRLPPGLQHRMAWLLSQWPGRVALRSAASCMRLGIFDRSMTLAAQFFTSVLPILILAATWVGSRDTNRLADALNMPDESRKALEDAVGTSTGAFGIVGTLMVLISATSLSRAFTRAFATIWDVPKPKNSIHSAWRWLAVVVTLALSLVALRALVAAAAELPPPGLWRLLVAAACDLGVAVFVPWVLLESKVRPRLLLTGALIYAGVMCVVRPAAALWLPKALESSADHYGTIGVAFTYIAWLYVVAWIFLAAAVLGHVITTDRGSFGAWIRGSQVASSTLRDAQ